MALSEELKEEIRRVMEQTVRVYGLNGSALSAALEPLGVTGLRTIGSHYLDKVQFIAGGERLIFTIKEDRSVMSCNFSGQ